MTTLDLTSLEEEDTTPNLLVRDSVGFLTDLGPTICGGDYYSAFTDTNYITEKCYILTNGKKWNNSFNLTIPRADASVIQISASKALVIGGYDENGNDLNTMETVNSSGSTRSENTLPFVYALGGCATKVNETHGLLIGGWQDGNVSSHTHFINLNTLETSPGPELKQKRERFGCAVADNTKVVVGGGVEDSWPFKLLATTEILDLTMPNPSWTSG